MTTALLAIHYQNDIVHPEGKIRAGGPDLVEAAQRLLGWARSRSMPVVSVRIAFPPDGVVANSPILAAAARDQLVVEGTWGADFLDELAPADCEAVVTHSRINAFFESDLEDVLRGLGASRLVIAGVATHSSVEHTARHAADLGYEVVVAADACASPDAELHAAALRVLEPHVARIATVGEVLDG